MRTIALITDFGYRDNFVGVIKAVILNINPTVYIVDITHSIESHNIKQAAFLLWKSYRYFPQSTIFLVVVDPGVGSSRRPIAVKTKNYYFVAPDNGVLFPAVKEDGIVSFIHLTNRKFFNQEFSSTFHGRDIFAPVAAHISAECDFAQLGKKINKIKQLFFPSAHSKPDRIIGEIIYIDKFGNLVTNIKKQTLLKLIKRKRRFVAYIKGKSFHHLCNYYEEKKHLPFFIEGSFSYLEVSLNKRSAKEYFGIRDNEKVKIEVFIGK